MFFVDKYGLLGCFVIIILLLGAFFLAFQSLTSLCFAENLSQRVFFSVKTVAIYALD